MYKKGKNSKFIKNDLTPHLENFVDKNRWIPTFFKYKYMTFDRTIDWFLQITMAEFQGGYDVKNDISI